MSPVRRDAAVAFAVAAVLALTGCTVVNGDPLPGGAELDVVLDVGPRTDFVDAGPDGVRVVDGDDWTLPEHVRPAENSGYFSEEASTEDLVAVRSIDVSWRQIQPEQG